MYQLIIRDNGIGKGSSCGGGIGLSNMQERVETLKGSIHFESTRDFGFLSRFQKKSRRIFMKVLIVDDDFFITTALKTILEADPEIQVCGLGKNGKRLCLFMPLWTRTFCSWISGWKRWTAGSFRGNPLPVSPGQDPAPYHLSG